MTKSPEEKAEELIKQFKPLAHGHYDVQTGEFYEEEQNARDCALIAVGLRIEAYSCPPVGAISWADNNESFWQQVKAELEKK